MARQEAEQKKGKKGKKDKGKLTIDDILAQKKAEEEEARKKDTFQVPFSLCSLLFLPFFFFFSLFH